MDLSHPTTIEEIIIFQLKDGEMITTLLLEKVREVRRNTTKQGFYAALRKLKKQEVVVVYKRKAALNTSWIWEMQRSLQSMERAYAGSEALDVLTLSDKESITYSFQSIQHLDAFWGHTQNILIKNLPISEAVYAYDPHYWFYLARRDTETKLLTQIVQSGRQFLMTVGGTTALDKSTGKEFKTDLLQYHSSRLFDTETYYVVVIGDFVTEVFLDPFVAKKVDAIYTSLDTSTADSTRRLESLLSVRGRSRLRISRNKTKAEKLRTKLKKPFFVR